MRRSCLTFLRKSGVDIFTLQKISVHADVKTLQHYIHVDETELYDMMLWLNIHFREVD
ncbi:tyrosine-type recombinase/integrase [Desertibacillus haloalkaliphilus]|nr:tyrosine-type recombinase/integrase [Desertibacillus haloalkaliphilus]